MRRSTRTLTATAAITLLVLAGLTACAAPSGGTVVGQGCQRGQFSIIAPVSYYWAGTTGQVLNVVADDDVMDGEAPIVTVTGAGHTVAPVVSGGRARYTLPVDATYKVELRYGGYLTSVRKYVLCLSLDEDRGTAGLGGLPNPLPGQHLTLTYQGSAGERLNTFNAGVLDAGGTPVPENGILRGQHTLPTAGPYTIVVTGSGQNISHDIAGGAATIGSTTSSSLLTNQHVSYTYAGTAGEALTAFVQDMEATVFDPGGTKLSSTAQPQRLVLASTGTYTIVATQYSYGPVTLWLSHDHDGGALVSGSTTVTGLVPGQSSTFTYDGTAGQVLWTRVSEYPPGVRPYPRFTAPDGTDIPWTYVWDGTESWATSTLPVTGTYHALLVQTSGATSYTVLIA